MASHPAAPDPAAAPNSAATPREVLAAVFPTAPRVAGLTLAVVSLGHFLLLEALESPFVEEGGSSTLTALDVAIAVYVLTHPVEEVHVEITGDRAHFLRSVHAFAATIPARELVALGAKIRQSIDSQFEPVVGGGDEKKATGAATA